jgi:hypothetical protein
MMDIEAERQHLLEQIRQHADPEHQAMVSRVVPTGLKVYGLRVPQLRGIVRAWGRAHQQIAHDYLLEHYKHLIPDLTRADFEHCDRASTTGR